MNRLRDSQPRDRERVQAAQIARAHSGTPQPVPLETRSLLEPLFGHDFADVRIYSDSAAANVADDLHAKAFTVGQDIAFATGRYDPHTGQGQRLLAHELAHTVQQRHATPNGRGSLEVSERGDPLERNANAIVSSLGRGSFTPPAATSSGLAVQCEDAAEPEIGYSLDPSDPNAHVAVPVGDGTASAVVNTSGAGLNLEMPDLTAQAGYDWRNGPYANGQYQMNPTSSVGVQADANGVGGYFQTPELQLNGGVTDGYAKPFFDAHVQAGPLTGDLEYTTDGELDANAGVVWPGGGANVGTSGAGVQQQFGPIDTSLMTDYERLEAEARLNTSIAGQPVDLTGRAGMGLDGSNPSVGIQGTAPDLLGLPISPTVGVTVGPNGVDPNAGLGIRREF